MKRERHDRIDAEFVNEMLQTRGYAMVRKRLNGLQAAKLRELVHPHNEIETATLRGFLQAVDVVLQLPAILIREGKEIPK